MWKRRWYLCLGGILIAGVLWAGCGMGRGESPSHNPTQITQGVTDMAISTPYGELRYPDQWEEFVRTEQKQDGDTVTVSFSAEVGGNTYELFVVTIGGAGDPVGTITDAEGTRHNVSLHMVELPELDGLTEGEQNRLYAMQEDLNYLLDNLK